MRAPPEGQPVEGDGAARERASGEATGLDARRQHYRRCGLHTDEQVGWLLTRAAERWPDREAVICEGQRWTFAALHDWTGAVARALVERGIAPGDRLLWQLPNSVEALVLHLAAWRIGAVSVPVVPIYREHEMRLILRDVRPRAVAFSAALGARRPAVEMDALMESVGVRPALKLSVGGSAGDGWLPVPEPPTRGGVMGVGLPPPLPPDACCLVLYTSGTTSAPKGAMHASRSLLATIRLWRDTYHFTPEDCFIAGSPITHVAGLLLAVLLPAATGARAVVMPSWDPDRAVALCECERATFSCGATVFLQGFVERYEAGAAPVHRLPRFMCGGAAVPPAIIERASAVGVQAWRCWGMTEAPTATLATPEDSLERRARRDGFPTEGCEIEAVDALRRPLPLGEQGELRVRCAQQMLGYSDAEANAAQLDRDDWFYTGDVGFVDGEGWVTMTGRKKDIINRGGEKFSSQDIEHAIASHPVVESVAVVGVPDPRLGEAVAAFLVLRRGAPWPGEAEIVAHLETQRLARPKIPVHWQVVESLPMTLSGKVQKHLLVNRWHAERSGAPCAG